ncbi:hypothetical protein [Actinomadura sp. 21ATH]|uniref:hypothetical protein n=1 Tax=Actinomadura sp. 21ATH TaxID=1735444 RepID=UPI0035C05990
MNGLISPDRWCGTLVHTGVAQGDVAVSVELCRHAPPPGARPPRAGQDWEEVVEVHRARSDGELQVAADYTQRGRELAAGIDRVADVREDLLRSVMCASEWVGRCS